MSVGLCGVQLPTRLADDLQRFVAKEVERIRDEEVRAATARFESRVAELLAKVAIRTEQRSGAVDSFYPKVEVSVVFGWQQQ